MVVVVSASSDISSDVASSSPKSHKEEKREQVLDSKVSNAALQSEGLQNGSSASQNNLQSMLAAAGRAKHATHLRKAREEKEMAEQIAESVLSDFCDKAVAIPQEDSAAFYAFIETKPDFLDSNRCLNILLQRVYGNVELLPERWKAALEERGKNKEAEIHIELSKVYLSRNHIFKLSRCLKNICSITLKECVFEKEENILFNPNNRGIICRPSPLHFPRIKAIFITGGHILLPKEGDIESQVSGLNIAKHLVELEKANCPPSDYKQALPQATEEQLASIKENIFSDVFKAWLKRSDLKPYSGSRDLNLIITDLFESKHVLPYKNAATWA